MTNIVQYHPSTNNLALFESHGQYWVGSWSPHTTHQNGEPQYVFVDGYWAALEEGTAALIQMTGNEF